MLIECKQKSMNMRTMENAVVKEVTKEEFEVVELVEDVERSFFITAASQVILRETARTPQEHVSIVNPLNM